MTLETKIDDLIKIFQKAQKDFFESIDGKILKLSNAFDAKISLIENEIIKLNRKISVEKRDLKFTDFLAVVDDIAYDDRQGVVSAFYLCNGASLKAILDHVSDNNEPLFKFRGSVNSKITLSYGFTVLSGLSGIDIVDAPGNVFLKAKCKIFAAPGIEVIRESDVTWFSCPAKITVQTDPSDNTAYYNIYLENCIPSFSEKGDFKPLTKEYSIFGIRLNDTFLI